MIVDPLAEVTAYEQARRDAVQWVRESLGSMDVSFDRMTRVVGHLLDMPLASFALVEADHQLLKSTFGFELERTAAEEGLLCRTCVAANDLLVVEDTTADPRFATSALVLGPPHIRFYAGMPVRAPNGMPVGTLCVVDTRPRILNDASRAVLGELRDALEEIIQLRTLSIRDPLTGLFNRRYFDELLEREWRRTRRHRTDLTAVMVDIDHFKAFNDTYGHAAGDQALKTVAGVLAETYARAGDVVARIGGEEFAAVLPQVDASTAVMLADRLRAAVRATSIPHAASPEGLLTISVGVTTATGACAPAEPGELLRAADIALYDAKRLGRDTTVNRLLADLLASH